VTVNRRTFVIDAGKAFPAGVGAPCIVGCGDSGPTSPSTVADVSSTSTVVNAHSVRPAAPVDTYTSSSSLSHVHMVTLTANKRSTIAFRRFSDGHVSVERGHGQSRARLHVPR
jgi:hypothetical protein